MLVWPASKGTDLSTDLRPIIFGPRRHSIAIAMLEGSVSRHKQFRW